MEFLFWGSVRTLNIGICEGEIIQEIDSLFKFESSVGSPWIWLRHLWSDLNLFYGFRRYIVDIGFLAHANPWYSQYGIVLATPN